MPTPSKVDSAEARSTRMRRGRRGRGRPALTRRPTDTNQLVRPTKDYVASRRDTANGQGLQQPLLNGISPKSSQDHGTDTEATDAKSGDPDE